MFSSRLLRMQHADYEGSERKIKRHFLEIFGVRSPRSDDLDIDLDDLWTENWHPGYLLIRWRSNIHLSPYFTKLFVFELEARTGQTDRHTDGQYA